MLFLNWEIDGTTNALSWNTERPDDLWVGHRGRPNELLKRDAAIMHPAAAATSAYPGGHVEGYPDTFRALFTDFYAHVASKGFGPAHYPTFEAGLRSLQVCDAVAQSAAVGSWVRVS